MGEPFATIRVYRQPGGTVCGLAPPIQQGNGADGISWRAHHDQTDTAKTGSALDSRKDEPPAPSAQNAEQPSQGDGKVRVMSECEVTGFALPEDGWFNIATRGEWPHKPTGLVQVLDDAAIAAIIDAFVKEYRDVKGRNG